MQAFCSIRENSIKPTHQLTTGENYVQNIVTSSPKTRAWLELIIAAITKQNPQLEYFESKYWAAFKNPISHRNIVYLQPTKKQIRLHTPLPLSYDDDLEASSATKHWAATCPSLFRMHSEFDVEKAVILIIGSYNYDMTLK